MKLYQVLVIVISALMLFQGFQKFKDGGINQTVLKLLIRVFVWGGIMLVAIFPNFSNVLAKIIGLEGNINAVILIGFILIFLFIFKLVSLIEKLEGQITEIIRRDSIKELNK